MPSNLQDRIKALMDEQAEEASQPVSYATLESEDEPEQRETPEESQEPPDEPIEPPAAETAPESTQDVPEPESEAPVGLEDVPPPEESEVPPPEDYEVPEEVVEPVPEMAVEEDGGREFQPEEPDWESMLGYVGQQANDQLFDGIAIRLAESTHRIISRTQDRFEQHMAELDIGNSY